MLACSYTLEYKMKNITKTLTVGSRCHNFLNQVIESLHLKGHLPDSELNDGVSFGFGDNRGFIIACGSGSKQMNIVTPVSNVGYFVFEDTRIESIGKPPLVLLDVLSSKETTTDENLLSMREGIRQFVAEVIIITHAT